MSDLLNMNFHNRIIGVRGDPAHPANFGKLYTKGATLALSAQASGRALVPQLRADKASPRQRVSWEAALDHAAERFAAIIREHGPDAVGFYISGQLLTEDYYVFNKLAKGLIGTNNVDTNSRLCMSSAVSGYKARFDGDRTIIHKLRDLMVTFTPDFEILPGTAPTDRQVPPGRSFALPASGLIQTD